MYTVKQGKVSLG